MTDSAIIAIGCLTLGVFGWLVLLHREMLKHIDRIVDHDLRIRALQDHVNRIQREVRR